MKYDSKKFKIEYKASFVSDKANNLMLWIAQPKNSTYQKITNFSINKKPTSIYKDNNQNKIIYFKSNNIKKLDIQIILEATLWKTKNTLNKNINFTKDHKLLEKYTKSEDFLEKMPEIIKFTHEITKKDKNILDKIISINQFLRQNFKYCPSVQTRGVKNLNLKKLKGDCGEVGALFVTICRILGIPTINKTGFIIYHDELNNIYEHGWTSIYLENYGWLEIDPLAENIKKRNVYYYKQENYLLSFCNGFNIKLNPEILSSYKIDYWNKLRLPMSYDCVQILQPLVFASKHEVNFEDRINLQKKMAPNNLN